VNADAIFDPLDLRHFDILFGHDALNFDGAAYGIYDAPELNESAVPGILDDAPASVRDEKVRKAPIVLQNSVGHSKTASRL